MNIFVTGCAGYIGSHILVELLTLNYTVIGIDNFTNSTPESLERVKEISGKDFCFYQGDVQNCNLLRKIFNENTIDAVIHLAGLKSVSESVLDPILYYTNNISSTLCLLNAMKEKHVKKIVFSSSATVYGNQVSMPIKENAPLSANNPYGQTKLMAEYILKDLAETNNSWKITSLRYFNPIGAHSSGLIGEDPSGTPNNILPYISQVAIGKLKSLNVFGDNYETRDGTGLRDYIHVVDLAKAHIAALTHLKSQNTYKVYNIGTGENTSVLELIRLFSEVSGKSIPFKVVDQRPGDIASCYADPSLAHKELNWKSTLSIKQACIDSWKWQQHNPKGYDSI